jgi:hypothetical protein
VQRRTLELWTGEAVVETVRAARTTGREETEAVKAAVKAVVATVSARRALTTLHMTTLTLTLTASPGWISRRVARAFLPPGRSFERLRIARPTAWCKVVCAGLRRRGCRVHHGACLPACAWLGTWTRFVWPIKMQRDGGRAGLDGVISL